MRDDERSKRKPCKVFSRFALVRKAPQIGLGNRCSIPRATRARRELTPSVLWRSAGVRVAAGFSFR